jgi:hypothetical protein
LEKGTLAKASIISYVPLATTSLPTPQPYVRAPGHHECQGGWAVWANTYIARRATHIPSNPSSHLQISFHFLESIAYHTLKSSEFIKHIIAVMVAAKQDMVTLKGRTDVAHIPYQPFWLLIIRGVQIVSPRSYSIS